MTGIDARFMKNIRYLAKKRCIRIGDLEQAAGVRNGFLSTQIRLGGGIDFEVALDMATRLGVNVYDVLLIEAETDDGEESYQKRERKMVRA